MRVPVPDELLPADQLGRVHFVGIGGAGLSGIARIMLARGITRQRQRRQGVRARSRRCARSARTLLRRPRRRPASATPTPWWSRPRCARTTPRWSRPQRRGLRLLPRSAALESVMQGRRRGRRRRHPRQDHHHLAAHGRAPALRRRPVVRDRRRPQRVRLQRPRRQRRALRRRGRRERRRLPGLLAVRRAGHQRRGRPPRQLRHRGGLPRRVRHLPRPDRARRLPGRLRRRPRGRRPAPCGASSRGRASYGWGSGPTPTSAPRTCASPAPPRRFTVVDRGRRLGEVTLQIPGRHYVLDALAALACGLRLGLRLRRPAPRPRGLQRHPPPDGAQGRGRRRPGLRQLRPPPQRDRRRPAGRPVAGGRGPGRGRLPAAPGLAHPDLRPRRWAWRSAPPTRSS